MGLAAWVVLVLDGRRRAVVGAGWRRKEEKQQIPRTWLVGLPRPSSHFHSRGQDVGWQGAEARW